MNSPIVIVLLYVKKYAVMIGNVLTLEAPNDNIAM